MGDGGSNERLLGQCTACGSIYAARRQRDGSLLPIGKRDGCRCGSTEFVEVDPGADDADES